MFVAEILHCTYNDYKLWEEEWESIEGIPVSISPVPMKIHQCLAGELFFALNKDIDDCMSCEILYTVKFDICEAEGVQYYILVYSNDQKVEVYSLKEGRYIKVGEYTREILVFEDIAYEM